MDVRICPCCKCVYDNGRTQCIDCCVKLVPATEEQVRDFNQKNSKALRHQSDYSSSIIPTKWQIIGAASLLAFGLLMFILNCFGLTKWAERALSLFIIDIISAAVLLIPQPKLFIYTGKTAKKRMSFIFVYRRKALLAFLTVIIILNFIVGVFIAFDEPFYIRMPDME